MRRFFKIALMIILCFSVFAGGCGGGKKNKQEEGKPEGRLNGTVDLYSGFGVEPGLSKTGKLLSGEVVAKLYRIQADGGALAPVSEVEAKPLNAGVFSLEKAPIGERNLIVRIEKVEGEPILSAFTPPASITGDNVVVSPETDMEVALFMDVAAKGLQIKGDVKPSELDETFIKKLIGPEMFFDFPASPDKAAVVGAMSPVARSGYMKYIQGLLGEDAKPGDKEMSTLLGFVTAPLMKIEIARESRNPVSKTDEQDYYNALDSGLDEAGVFSEALQPRAVWNMSRRQAMLWIARCLSKPGETPACPAREKDAADLGQYGLLLENSLAEEWGAEDLEARVNTLFPEASATGARRLPPVDVVEKLLDLPEGLNEPFKSVARSFLNGEMDTRAQAELKVVLSNFRDSVLLGAVGLDARTSFLMLENLFKDSQALFGVLQNPGSTVSQAGQVQRQFVFSYDSVFQPLSSAVRSKFSKLETVDQNKLIWALYEIILNTTLFDIPADMYVSNDTDGDRIPDNVERMMGTEASDKNSSPSEVLTATPRSILPPQPVDSDKDGFFDVVEIAVGTSPESQASKPEPGKMKFCDKPGPVCPAIVETVPEEIVYSVKGTTFYQSKPVSNLVVGLYPSPDFLNKAPLFKAEEVTGAEGGFLVKGVREGKYFAAAFRDSDGDGKPGNSEIAGFAGGEFPNRVTVGNGVETAPVRINMLGVIGKPRCEEGKAFDPAGGACVDKCPAGFEKDELSSECRCEAGKLFIETEGVCGDKCPEGTTPDTARGGCFCPKGTTVDKTKKMCGCPDKMFLDGKSNTCRCKQGSLHTQTMTCVDKCPGTFTIDATTGTCVCPEGSVYDEKTLDCSCSAGMMDVNQLKCVKVCGSGMRPDAAGAKCECPAGEGYDKNRNECVCKDGKERTAQGECGNPKIPSKTPEDNLKGGPATGTVPTPLPPATGDEQ